MTTQQAERRLDRPASAVGLAPVRIGVGPAVADAALSLPVSVSSCWTRVLGAFELPTDDALDTLATAMEAREAPPAAVELVGAPAACLLPLLWLRTIWLAADAPVVIRWDHVGRPGADMREQLAARLCCAMADRVDCPDAARAHVFWGIDTDDAGPVVGDAFDMLLGLVDSWDIAARNGPITDPNEWLARAQNAMRECAEQGAKRVALYGAGTHTRALGPLLMSPPVEIVCIIDDDTSRHGGRLWGFPIVSREQALAMGVEAVILSANAFEPALVANAEVFGRAGVRVVRLYPEVSSA